MIRALALAAFAVAGCGIERQSTDFECDSPDQCGDGRDCVEGFCVVSQCPFPCTSCQGEQPDGSFTECIIDCQDSGSCSNRDIDCPSGMACTVRCNTNNACSGVDCSDATSCSVECSDQNSCDGQITCGDGPCSVTCSGTGSCDNGVDCETSCRCDVACTGVNACNDSAQCPDITCLAGLGCTSAPGGQCNTCP